MNRYKVVGIINLLSGIYQMFMSLGFPLFVFPKVTQMYETINTDNQPNLTVGYIIVLIILLISIINFFLGIKGIKGSAEKEKYFKYGILWAVISFFLTSLLMAILTMNIIAPLYSLTSSL